MMGLTPLLAGATVCACIVGAWLHEGTHALVAWALGYDVEVDWVGLTTYYSDGGPERPLAVRLVSLAPQAVGAVVAAVAVVLGLPPLVEALPLYAGWGIYTLAGGMSDYSRAISVGQEHPIWSRLGMGDASRDEQQVYRDVMVGLGLMLAGDAAMRATGYTSAGRMWWFLHVPIFVGIGLASLALKDAQTGIR